MAVLAFPPSSIIGATDTGKSVLTAPDALAGATAVGLGASDVPTFLGLNVNSTGLTLAGGPVSLTSPAPNHDNVITSNPSGISLNCDDLHLINMAAGAEFYITTGSDLILSATGGVFVNGSNFNVSNNGLAGESVSVQFTPTFSVITLGDLSAFIIQTENLVSTVLVNDNQVTVYAGDQTAYTNWNYDGVIEIAGTRLLFNQKKVATEPIAAALAIALG